MVNNFDQIKQLLKFENENEFYFVQILQRKKENPELGRNNRLVKAYYIYSIEKLEKYKEEIIKMCEVFNARAYIHLNRRNSKQVGFEMLELLATNLKLNQTDFLGNLYNSVCGHHHSDKDKTWIIDIDEEDPILVEAIETATYNIEPIGNKIIAWVPTKNGLHLITKPFNSKVFGEKYPEIDLHKNNPSILFAV